MDTARTSGALALLGQTLRGSRHFHGRSSLAEVFNYVLCVVFFHLAIGIVLMLALNYPVFAVVQDILQVIYFLPVPALLVRRLHDQDRRAVLLWLAAPGVLVWIARKALAMTQPLEVRTTFDSYTWPVDLVAGLASLAIIIALLLPGATGPNRFGPDPRQP